MSQQPAGEKSEKATPERMRKARRDGTLSKSQDLTAWVVVALIVALNIALIVLTVSGQ